MRSGYCRAVAIFQVLPTSIAVRVLASIPRTVLITFVRAPTSDFIESAIVATTPGKRADRSR
jgi:hypothetical protein